VDAYIPHGERRFALEDVRRVIKSEPWERAAVHVELDDGTRLTVHHDSRGRAWDIGYQHLRRFIESDNDGELVLESTVEELWLYGIPFVIAAFILLDD